VQNNWGAKISSQTMTDWVWISAGWLEPLYKRMQHDLLAGGYVQADETPIRWQPSFGFSLLRGEKWRRGRDSKISLR
jgi:hypothetical protein